jgi:peptidoglycan/LPS O-acetylase OafA/YrhL
MNSDKPLYVGLLVQQAWSLEIELTAYLAVPFALKSKMRIILIFLMSRSLRPLIALVGFGSSDLWSK